MQHFILKRAARGSSFSQVVESLPRKDEVLNQILSSDEGKQRKRKKQQSNEQMFFLIQSLNMPVIGGGGRKTKVLKKISEKIATQNCGYHHWR